MMPRSILSPSASSALTEIVKVSPSRIVWSVSVAMTGAVLANELAPPDRTAIRTAIKILRRICKFICDIRQLYTLIRSLLSNSQTNFRHYYMLFSAAPPTVRKNPYLFVQNLSRPVKFGFFNWLTARRNFFKSLSSQKSKTPEKVFY